MSAYTQALDAIQLPTTSLLRAAGYKKKGRTYNRIVGDGLIHVVNFQMGQYPIGDYIIPGIRESFYGKFTVNLGVFLPCVWKLEHGSMPKHFVQDYHCEIRERLGALTHEGKDHWWSLNEPPHMTGDMVANLMRDSGLPFLDNYIDYRTVLAQFQAHGRLPPHPEGRNTLTAAIIYHHIGQTEQAQRLFGRAAENARAQGFPGFAEHIQELRARCGL